ncbi:very short patch repair endonuclease [Mucilaginibacter oryzae]|nr:very short patch repair endonuclease [Mucilaginibacter oryzae]
MTVVVTDKNVSKRMKGNKSKGTKPEILLRKVLTNKGIKGYRICYTDIIGKPDIVFIKKRIAVFVHGCFWHSCPSCNLKVPNKNNEFWLKKLTGNKNRDKIVLDTLETAGWTVVTVWECKLKNNPEEEVNRIGSLILQK